MTASTDPVDEVLRKLGRRLAGARVERGLTQAECAARAKVAADAISKLENGANAPHINTVAKIAHALGLELTVRETSGV